MYVSKICRLTKCRCSESLQVSCGLPLALLATLYLSIPRRPTHGEYSPWAYASSRRTGCRTYMPIQFVLSNLTRFSVVRVFGTFALIHWAGNGKLSTFRFLTVIDSVNLFVVKVQNTNSYLKLAITGRHIR